MCLADPVVPIARTGMALVGEVSLRSQFAPGPAMLSIIAACALPGWVLLCKNKHLEVRWGNCDNLLGLENLFSAPGGNAMLSMCVI